MPRLLSLLFYLAFTFLLVGSSHYYIWARLVRDTALAAPYARAAAAALVSLGLAMPVSLLLQRLLPAFAGRALTWVAYLWMGLFFIVLTMLLGLDAVRLLVFLMRRFMLEAPPMEPVRRLAVLRLLGSVVAVASFLAAAQAMRTALAGPRLERVQVALTRLPAALSGITIAQISDLHVASLIGKPYVERLVAQVNALQPALIAITGDLVDGSVPALASSVAPLGQLRAKYGVFFVTGNHEYYSGADAWIAELRRLGIRVLRNERVRIGAGAQSFELAGVDDVTAHHHLRDHGCDLPRALAGRDASRAVVLMAHQPKVVFEAAKHDVDLMLSGHTHAGQIWPFGYLVRLAQPYLAGLAQHGPTQIYVNRGTGFWGPPMRLGAAPELTLLELVAAD